MQIYYVSHAYEVRLLRKRAKAFLSRAFDSLNSGDYDLASFLSEQAVQLYLKSILLEKLGDYPRTYSISLPVSILKKTSDCALVKFLEENRREVSLLEDTCIASRYLVREYSRRRRKFW